MGNQAENLVNASEKKKQNRIIEWFSSNPLVGIIGILLSIVSILLSILFYFGSIAKPDFTYYVHPVKGIALQSNQTSDLSVYYKNRAIKNDLTVAQIAIWNNGKKPIKHSDVLESIKIVTGPQFPILEAKIRKTTRSVTGISLDSTKSDVGVIGIDWRVLEQDDGAIIQIIYEGSQNVNISVLGVVEGQKELSTVEYSSEIKSPDEQYSNPNNQKYPLIGLIIILVFSLVGYKKPLVSTIKYNLEMFKKENPKNFPIWRKVLIASFSLLFIGFYAFTIAVVFVAIYTLFNIVYIPFQF